MKKYNYLLISLCFFILLNNCNKSEESIIETSVDPYYTNLNDTTIFSRWANYDTNFELDIDKDSTHDVIITTYSYYTSNGIPKSYVRVAPVNYYKVAFSEINVTSYWYYPDTTICNYDLVEIPKIFHYGDTVWLEEDYTHLSTMITYYDYATGPSSEYYSGLQYGVEEDTNYYIAFRNTNGINNKLAWLKVKSNGASNITLSSCFYNEDEPYLIIE